MQPLALEQKPSLWVPQKNGAEKGDIFMSYLNSVTIVGFVGADPEQRQAGTTFKIQPFLFRRYTTAPGKTQELA